MQHAAIATSADAIDAGRPSLTWRQWRIIWLASLGGSLEFYDFIIYGIFASYISAQFFPSGDPNVSTILSFSVLALGFFARPLGGIIMGGIGDRIGRRPVFLVSIGMTTLATIGIGLLPSYATWGFAAPLLLVALRLVQGVCLGGELPGALTYAVEAAPQRSGLACAVIIVCLNAGIVLATAVNLAIQSALPAEAVAAYGWRIAFLLGGVVGLVNLVLRRNLEESPQFLQLHERVAKLPLRDLCRDHRGALLKGAAVVAVIAGFNGILYGFTPGYLVQVLRYPGPDAALAMTVSLIVGTLGVVVSGYLGDLVPKLWILRVGTVLIVLVSYPAYRLVVDHAGSLVLVLSLYALCFSVVSGIWSSILAELFPTAVRFSGIALAYNLSVTLLSGFAPLVATFLIQRTGLAEAPAFYIIGCTLLGLAGSFLPGAPQPENPRHRRNLDAPAPGDGRGSRRLVDSGR